MLPLPDRICLLDHTGPRARSSACYDGLVGYISSDNLKLGSIATIKDGAMIDHFDVGIDGG